MKAQLSAEAKAKATAKAEAEEAAKATPELSSMIPKWEGKNVKQSRVN